MKFQNDATTNSPEQSKENKFLRKFLPGTKFENLPPNDMQVGQIRTNMKVLNEIYGCKLWFFITDVENSSQILGSSGFL